MAGVNGHDGATTGPRARARVNDRSWSGASTKNPTAPPIRPSSMSHWASHGIALRSQERLADVGREDVSRSPLDELVAGGDRQHDAEDDEREPAAAAQRRHAEQDLLDDAHREEAEREVADAIVVIAREVEGLLRPVAERRLRVRVVRAVQQHQRVQEDGDVAEVAEAQPPVGGRQRDVAEQRGRDLQQPVEAPRPTEDQGQHQWRRDERQQDQRDARVLSMRLNHR